MVESKFRVPGIPKYVVNHYSIHLLGQPRPARRNHKALNEKLGTDTYGVCPQFFSCFVRSENLQKLLCKRSIL
jgi:hypothetical protein